MNTSLPSGGMNTLPNNQQRILAFDLARGICILLMMTVHTMDFYGAPEVHESLLGSSFKTLVGWPAASIFIFIMGIFISYNPNPSLSKGLKRAAILFLLGYALNFFRGSIPMWLSLQFGLVTYEDLGPHSPLTEFLIVDVLQFAGIAFAVCYLLQHLLPNPLYWLALALVITFSGPLVWDISSTNVFMDEILQLFWGAREQGVVFPQFPWLVYPIVGMAFGHWLKQSNDFNALFKKTAWVGVVIMLIGIGIILSDVESQLADNKRASSGVVIGVIAFTILFICLCQFTTAKVPHNPIFSLLYSWSNHVTVLYVISWILIGWGLMIFGLETLGASEVLGAMVGVIILTDLLTRVWIRLKSKLISQPNGPITTKANA